MYTISSILTGDTTTCAAHTKHEKGKEVLHRAKLNRSIIININNRNNKKGKQK